jgi:hypothetical protein
MALPPVYTEDVVRIPFTVPGFFGYTVPDGYRLIVHNITGLIYAESDSEAVFQITAGLGTYWQWICPPLRFRQFEWNGQQAVDAGVELGITLNTPGAASGDIAITGAVLTLP